MHSQVVVPKAYGQCVGIEEHMDFFRSLAYSELQYINGAVGVIESG